MKKILLVLAVVLIGAGLFVYVTLSKNSSSSTPIVTPTSRIVSPQTFIMLGDTGTGDTRQYKVAKTVQNYCLTNNCTAVFIAGDVIYDRGIQSVDDPQLKTKFEKPYQNIDLPFYLAFGNHDYFGCTTCYFQYASKSTKWHMPSAYYTVDFNGISFFVVNTEDFDQTQTDWLAQELTSSKARWKIVVGHRPVETTEETHGGEQWSGIKEFKQTICQTSDYYISGHAHILEDVGKLSDCKTTQLVSGAGGSYPRAVYPYSDSLFHFEGNGFLALTIENNQLQYEFLDVDGKILRQSDSIN